MSETVQRIPDSILALMAFASTGDPHDRRKVCDITMSPGRYEKAWREMPTIMRMVLPNRTDEHFYLRGTVFRPLD